MDYNLSRAIAQAVRNRFLNTEARVSAQGSPCGIYGGQSDNGIGLSPSSSISPVGMTLPLLHVHSCIISELDNVGQCARYRRQYH